MAGFADVLPGFDPGVVVESLPVLVRGALVTLQISALGILLAGVLAVPVAFARLSASRAVRALAFLYVDAVRGTPLLIQLYAIFYLPPLVGIDLTPLQSAVLALGLNGGAYTAEILRGGIVALPKGQVESARSLGMTQWQAVRRIVLPQVVGNVLPALTNEAASLLKGSSLISVLAIIELTRAGHQLVGRLLRPLEIYFAVALLYLLVNAAIFWASHALERRLVAHR
ncbi:MAG TPA: amino acid ABC transporter permease [Thermodesulfobacteriota bacterium]